MKPVRRRMFAAAAVVFAAGLPAVLGAATPAPVGKRKVVILGIDGLDPRLLAGFMADGALPNFSRLAATGDLKELRTTAAAQSPVAWSTFITGMDPGGHGIFDFVHRDPATLLPRLSMAAAAPPRLSIAVGSWVLPLAPARVEQLRQGRAFWEILGERGVPTDIVRMPVNFPPAGARGSRELSGMGTPDLPGTSGTFSYYADALPANAAEFTGGQAYRVRVEGGVVDAKLHGPDNPFRRGPRELTEDFQVHVDRENRSALFLVGDREFVLQEKEWSDWIAVSFRALPPFVPIKAIARFYLKEAAPGFKLYVSPLQIDPADPAMPISSPRRWSEELCACQGYFSTLGLPHDTKAFSHGVLDGREFWDQLVLVDDESRRLLEKLLREQREGLLFFYFGSVDQGSHMLWHYQDERHPNHARDEFLAGGIRRLYVRMDEALGTVLERLDAGTTLVVMSDHGFAPFYRGVNLNTWLVESGYAALREDARRAGDNLFVDVDWRRSSAYALGLNGLYVNLKGREKEGIVEPGAAYERLLDRIEADLLALRDPATGERAVTKVTRPRRDFHGPFKDAGPDLIVGYAWGYRSSWESPLGAFPREVFTVNRDAWSGDHCIDNRLVPGVLLSNRAITLPSPGLEDLTVAVLDEFGVPAPPGMLGRDCLGDGPPRAPRAAREKSQQP